MYYQANKIASKTRTTEPSLTDQSQAASTDVNVILKGHKFGQPALGRGAAQAPAFEDYTNLPDDYRQAIELARQLPNTWGKLPPQLRNIPIDQLINKTPNELTAMLTPKPADPPAEKEEKK